jgi:hypothetical protein
MLILDPIWMLLCMRVDESPIVTLSFFSVLASSTNPNPPKSLLPFALSVYPHINA